MLLFNLVFGIFEKLVLVLAIFALITETSKEDKLVLKRVLGIYYSFHFYKNKKNKVRALINLGNKVNMLCYKNRPKDPFH